MQLNEQNYFSLEADQAYFSASQIKSFKRCEAATMAALNGEYERPMSQALLQGQFVDEALTGNYAEWVMKHPEISKRDGNLKAEYMLCQEMVSRARRDEVFMDFLAGDRQQILKGELFGVPFKVKLDVINWDLRIVDLKTVRDMNSVYLPGQGRVDFATAWDWPLQMAIYQKIVEQATGKRLPCYLAVITKESPADLAVIHVEEERMEAELAWMKQVLPRYEAIKAGIIEPERCEHCAYCRETKVLTGAVSLSEYEEMGGTTNE